MCLLTVTAQEDHNTVIAHPGQDIELLCTLTPSDGQTAAWIINDGGLVYTVQQLHNGILTEYSTNGNNLIIENIMMNDGRNDTKYSCVTVPVSQPMIGNVIDESNLTILYVAGEYQYALLYSTVLLLSIFINGCIIASLTIMYISRYTVYSTGSKYH